jgi:hypothetical protein
MRLIFLCFLFLYSFIGVQAQVTKCLTISAGGLASQLSAAESQKVHHLVLKGKMDARDFKVIREHYTSLISIDLEGIKIVSHSGSGGIGMDCLEQFPEDAVPENAFCSPKTLMGLSKLEKCNLPSSVKIIGSTAFQNCKALNEVKMPSGLNHIANYAFSGCTRLSNLKLPNQLEFIGGFAFHNCQLLEQLKLPASVRFIGYGAFKRSGSIEVDASNLYYTSVDGVLFNKDTSRLIYCPIHKTGNYVVPSSVTVIGGEAFSGCEHLVSVTLPEGLKSIGDYAFSDCIGLRMIITLSSVPVNLRESIFVFHRVDKAKCTLYVPQGADLNYLAAGQWDEFVLIESLSGQSLPSTETSSVNGE